jgi:hypothetical protein
VYKFASVVKFVFVHPFSREGEDALRERNNNFLCAVLIMREILLAFSLKPLLHELVVASLLAIS